MAEGGGCRVGAEQWAFSCGFQEASVELAVKILDGARLRVGGVALTVSPAKFEQKGATPLPVHASVHRLAQAHTLTEEGRCRGGVCEEGAPQTEEQEAEEDGRQNAGMG